MSQQFEWQTEDDVDWDSLPPDPAERRPGLRKLTVVVMLIVVAGISGFLFWRFNLVVQQGIANTEEDVVSSFALYDRAVRLQDKDLTRSLISGANSKWSFTHLEMVAEDMVFNRTPFSMQLREDEPTQVVEIITDETLTEAELITEQAYYHVDAEGRETAVTLQQTIVIRKGVERWLVARPHRGYWDGWESASGDFLNLSYPGKDAELLERMLPHLEAAVGVICENSTLPCPRGDQISIRFDTDPQSLLVTADPARMMLPQRSLELPTPTLVGLPVDEAGYDAVVQAYAAFIINFHLLDVLDWDCCARGLFHQALLDWQLAELGLRPWPMEPDQYQRLQRRGTEAPDLSAYWEMTPRPLWGNPQRAVYAFTAFLLNEETMMTPYELQVALEEADSYTEWVQSVTGRSVSDPVLRRSWARFFRYQLPVVPDQQAAGPGVSR